MKITKIKDKINNTDLNIYQCGYEDCSPDHFYGPALRDHYLIHYVISGKGVFDDGEKTYKLQKGQGFLICPDIKTYYEADAEDPWAYMWVGFQGLKAKSYLKEANLNVNSPVFSVENDYIDDKLKESLQEMNEVKNIEKSTEVRLVGLLYKFISYLIENNNFNAGDSKINSNETKGKYLKKAIIFIEKNYSHDIGVKDISDYLGLHRSYLYSLFKNKMNIAPQEYLIKFRINKALELMKNTDLSIGDVARSVGYNDPLNFSKIFKQRKKVSPSKYREKYFKKGK